MAVTTANNHHFVPPYIDISTLSHSELLSLSLLSSTSSPLSSLHFPTSSSSFNESDSSHRQTFSTTPTRRRIHRGLTKQERSESASIVSFLKEYLNKKEKRIVEVVNRDGVVVDLAALEERDKDGGEGLYDEELRRRAAGREKEEELLEMMKELEGEWCSWRMKRRIVDACLLGDALPVGWKVVVALRRKGGRFSPYCRHYISPTGEQFSSCKEVSSYLRPYFGVHDIEVPRDSTSGVQRRRLILDNDQCIDSRVDNSIMVVPSSITTSDTTLAIELEKDLSVSCIDNLLDVQIQDHYECHTCKLSFDGMDKFTQHLLSTHERTTKRFKLGSSVGNGLIVGDGYYDLSPHEVTTKRFKLGSSVGDELITGDGKYELPPHERKTKRLKFCSSVGDGFITGDGKHELSPHKQKRKIHKLNSSVGNEVIIRDGKNELSPNRTIKKHKLGSSVADGVIIRDGKYECQFCDKVFEERRRYLGHVGNHVKGSIKCTKGSLLQGPDTSCIGLEPAKIGNSRMDALIEIAQSSIPDIVPSEIPTKEPSTCNNVGGISIARNPSTKKSIFYTRKKLITSLVELDVEKCVKSGKAQSSHLNPCVEISRSSSACHSKMETYKGFQKDKTVSKNLCPCNKVSELSVTGGDTNTSEFCLVDYEMEKDRGEAKYPSGELHSCGDMRKGSMPSENVYSSPCQNGLEMEKDAGEDRTSLLNFNTQAQVSIDMTVGETKQQAVTCNAEQFGKKSCVDASMMPDGKNDPSANYSIVHLNYDSTTSEAEVSAEESEGDLDICFLTCDDKQADAVAAGENFQSNVAEQEAEDAHYDDDHDLVGETHTFGCSVPQKLFSASSPFDDIFGKAGQNICSLDSNLENMSELEYMKLDVIQPQMYKYNAISGEDAMLLPDVSMDLGKDAGFNLGFDASGKSQTELSQNVAQESMTTTVCVWCGIEFSQEIADIEPQPDSVGFMCPACRSKISTQFTELESNFSLNPTSN